MQKQREELEYTQSNFKIQAIMERPKQGGMEFNPDSAATGVTQ